MGGGRSETKDPYKTQSFLSNKTNKDGGGRRGQKFDMIRRTYFLRHTFMERDKYIPRFIGFLATVKQNTFSVI